jgi:6-phosphofructokinase 2
MTAILTVALNPAVDISGDTGAIRPTLKTRLSNVRYDPGGGGVNVARVVKRFGLETEVLFCAGGETGELLDHLLEAESVQRKRVTVPGRTRISYTVHETGTSLEYRFVPEGAKIGTEGLEACLDYVAATGCKYLVTSGSLPEGAPVDIYARMATATRIKGGRLVLDSSGPGLKETIRHGGVFLVKPSRGELEQLVGRKLDEEGACASADMLVRQGMAEIVAVTMGVDGAVLASRDGILRLPAIHVRTRSAVGAGDSFLGAMVWALAEGWSREDAFRLGMAAGASAVMTPGTELCRPQDVFRLYKSAKA